MGKCTSKKTIFLSDIQKLNYPRLQTIKIDIKDTNNQIIAQDIIRLPLRLPRELYNQKVYLESLSCLENEYLISACVLPGADPRGYSSKEC